MKPLPEAIQRGEALRRNARGPRARRQWQKIEPPQDPRAQPVSPLGFTGADPMPVHASPIPIVAGGSIPQRPLPPIAVGQDSLRQFSNSGAVPQRRVFTPAPL